MDINTETNPCSVESPTQLKLRAAGSNLKLKTKIILAFSGLLLMFSISTVFTLIKISIVEKDAISVVESQEPITVNMLSLSQDINHSISLLNEIINSNRDKDKRLYRDIESNIFKTLKDIVQTQGSLFSQIQPSDIKQLQNLLAIFTRYSRRILSLSEDFEANYPGTVIAAEELNPLALEYLAFLNEILGRERLDIPDDKQIAVRNMLFDLRYSWIQLTNSFRISFVNNLTLDNDGTINIENYQNQNKQVLTALLAENLDIGFDDIEKLDALHDAYLKVLPEVIKMQTSDTWRTDLVIMDSKLKPIVAELRILLDNLVQNQLSASMKSGTAVTNNLQQIRIYTSTIFLIAIIISLWVSVLLLRAIIPPLKNVIQAADYVSQGDLSSEVIITTNDEIGKLGKAFNSMIVNLRDAETDKQKYLDSLQQLNMDLEQRVVARTADLEASETRIRAIHDNVGEGILVIDDQFCIETVNRVAVKMFGLCTSHGISHILSVANAQAREEDIDIEKFIRSMDSQQITELMGLGEDGKIFPVEMSVTTMSIADKELRVCIIRDITNRKKVEERLAKAQSEVVNAAHKSGMAEMATGVLHNIGNILNSVNISVEEVSRVVSGSKITGLLKANELLSKNMSTIGEFLTQDKKGKKLPEYYLKLGVVIDEEFKNIASEIETLSQKTTMMKDVISTQQSYATAGLLSENFSIAQSIDDALLVQNSTLSRRGVEVEKNIEDLPIICAQKSRLLQVISNLIKNASEAMDENDISNKAKRISIAAGLHNKNSVYINVTDTGCGVSEENLSSIFQHGFTTKESGHGFGLHASANAMTEMGGTLTVSSHGVGFGASFTITVPISVSGTNSKFPEDVDKLTKVI